MGRVRTVAGDIPAGELGTTVMHEHLLLDNPWRMEPKNETKRIVAETPVCMNMRGEIFRDANLCWDNNILDSVSDALAEVKEYKKAGGRSFADVTPPEDGRNPTSIAAISKASGLNITCGTGWYTDFSFSPFVRQATVDTLSEIMARELTERIDGTEIRAGVIGEIGCSFPWTKDERKVMEAAAVAQMKTNAPISIHPGLHDLENRRYVKEASQYLDLLQKKGVNLNRVIVGHMDFTCDDIAYHRSLIDKYGVVLAYDNFGNEMYYDTLYPGCGGMPDKMRVRSLVELLKSGYEKHFVLGQDICLKIALKKYGGYGYSHVLAHIVPELETEGVTRRQIDTMLIENPSRLLAWA